jgi:hypothetical protein
MIFSDKNLLPMKMRVRLPNTRKPGFYVRFRTGLALAAITARVLRAMEITATQQRGRHEGDRCLFNLWDFGAPRGRSLITR